MKCLWKLTKIIPQLLASKSIKTNDLLLDVHEFLAAAPPSEWKAKVAEKKLPAADMPLRTVKTILHELVNVLGSKIMDEIMLIPDPGTSHAVAYLKQMLDNEKKKSGASSPNKPQSVSASPPPRPTSTSPIKEAMSPVRNLDGGERRRINLTEIEMNTILSRIFDKISNKDQTKVILSLISF